MPDPSILDELDAFAEQHGLDPSTRKGLEVLVRRATLRVALESAITLRTEPDGPDDGGPAPARDPNASTLSELLDVDPSGEFQRPEVERYAVKGMLGHGGMAEVWEAHDAELGRDVALKVIRAGFAAKPRLLTRFREEARITAQLEHPAIMPIHEQGTLPDGRPFYTMPCVRGRTLGDTVASLHAVSGPEGWGETASGWTLRRLVEALRTVCEAAAYAHSRGVIHRDIKPSNVLLGRFGQVLLLDWGVARVLGQPAEAPDDGPDIDLGGLHEPTVFGVVTGTQSYMAPEQAAAGARAVGPPADIWALGVVLYTLLAGLPPHATADGRRAAAAGEPPPLPGGGPPAPAELVDICRRSMQVLPEDRFPDAGALAAALTDWLDGARRREQARATLQAAEPLLAEARGLTEEAEALAAQARARTRALSATDPLSAKRPVWALEDEAARRSRAARERLLDYEQAAQRALLQDPELPEAHAALARFYQARHAEAEARGAVDEAARYERLLRVHDRGAFARYLSGEARITLHTDPPGAAVTLLRYTLVDRRLVPERVGSLGTTPLDDVEVPMGSYALSLEAPGRAPVTCPVLLGRGSHWHGRPPGEDAPPPIPLPDALGPDERYVPAGWFLAGGAGDAPAVPVWADGFVIQAKPVTNAQYLAFLNDLVARGRVEEALRWVPRERGGVYGELGAMIYGQGEDGTFFLTKDADGDMWDPMWPVFNTDWPSARAYARWLSERDGLPWRLPYEYEWEKAARGVDGRRFPWGEHFDATWTCTREGHTGRALPATVDDHPLDVGPYGVLGMLGNAADWCLDVWDADRAPPAGQRVPQPPPGEAGETFRAFRGDAWLAAGRNSHLGKRLGDLATYRMTHRSFRLVRPV
ncbi:MAG: SUMF1/EgtB/PvdO family nonheme iron enzyme [Alphaproteobacteria bacterium]|nr:SUMF1/EgtB/PvdO family nonheme iron enzyme [Alphaproteobacteria bacterium]